MTNEARKAVAMLPITQEAYESIPTQCQKQIGLDKLAQLGEVLEETLTMEVAEEMWADRMVWPELFTGLPEGIDYVMLYFTAYVIPGDEPKC